MGMSGENLRLYNELWEKQYQGITSADMAKTDLPHTTSSPDGGRYNAVFGAALFQQLQTSSVLFGALPKFAYSRSGFRVRKSRYVTSAGGSEATVAVSENGAVPDSVASDTLEVTVGTKEQALAIEISERMRLLATKNDDIAMDVANELEYAKQNFMYLINAKLNEDVTTVASTSVESIDRVVSSYAEVANCTGDVHTNDADIYSQDRDAAASWCDAYVDHNSSTTRALSKKIVAGLVDQTVRAGAVPTDQFWYTGSDTWAQLMLLYDSQVRYVQPEATGLTNPTADGKGQGINVGKEMATLYGRPVYIAPAGAVTANGDISNLYLLTGQYDPVYKEPVLGIKVLQAPIIAQTNLVNYPAHAKLGNEYLLYSSMELHCSRFKVQGKARDLAVIA
jgi:uncharacterized protein (UPF0254 family)